MKHLPWRETCWALAVLLALATVYAGAYYAMLVPGSWGGGLDDGGALVVYPTYRTDHEWLDDLFAPMFAIDRTVIRSGLWRERLNALRRNTRAHQGA